MTRSGLSLLLAATLLAPAVARGQYGGRTPGMYPPSAPKLPGVELQGPLDTALARVILNLNDSQAVRYAQVWDSFMVATRPQRDSANAAVGKMNDRLDQGDRAAAMFYAERLQDLGKGLKDRQDKFEDNLRRFLNGDQVKAYKKWRDNEQQTIENRQREDALRWQEAAFGGGGVGRDRGGTPEIKTALPNAHGVPAPDLGSQSVRLGRTLYVAAQLGVDSTGALAGPDLAAQATRAFANLGAVLAAAGASSRDVLSLTIYVVNYQSADLTAIRNAGGSYFGANAPVVNVVGVQSLGRDGARIAIGATALTSASPFGTVR
jgi:enamine deaminase RidA (YjgF/YER057c/UK114 family)